MTQSLWARLVVAVLLWEVPVAAHAQQPIYTNPIVFQWDAPIPDATHGSAAGYRLSIDGVKTTLGLVLTSTVVLPIGSHTVVVHAFNGAGESPASSPPLTFTVGQVVDPACTPPLGSKAISIFVTNLQKTGSGGALSRARLDFQLASPNSPITHVAVRSNGADMPGGAQDGTAPGYLGSLAGLWFTVPSTPGTYPLSVLATNVAGCTTDLLTTRSITVQTP